MDYIKIRFGEGFDFDRLGSGIERTISDMFPTISPMFARARRTWKPQMDMHETPDAIVILVELAGVKKEDLDIVCDSQAVRITGTRTEMPRSDNDRYRLAEIEYGTFERILRLPAPIDPEVHSVEFADGLLQIHLAKLPLARTYRISIEDRD